MGIRKAGKADVIELSALCRKTFYEAYSSYNTVNDMQAYMDTHFTAERLEVELSRSDATIFVYEDSGKLIGYVELLNSRAPAETNGRKSIEIARYYVDSSFQGKKIGKQLLEFSFNYGRDHNYELIWLGVWKKNTKAIEIYRHYGFTIAGTTKFVLGEDEQDDFIMIKQLSPI